MNDWLKFYRSAIDSREFSDRDPFIFKLFAWCLLKANWKTGWMEGHEVQPGQFITGEKSASSELKVNGSKWRRGIAKLKKFGCIDAKSTNRFTLITVLNWGKYQQNNKTENKTRRTTDEQPTNNRRTIDEQPTSNRRTTDDNIRSKEVKKDKKERTTSTLEQKFEEFWNVVHRKVGKQAAKRAFVKAAKAVAKDRECSTAAACDWIASRMIAFAASDDARHDVRGRLNPSTWLNEGRYDDDEAAWSESSEPPKSQFLSTEEMNAGIPPELLAKWEAEGV